MSILLSIFQKLGSRDDVSALDGARLLLNKVANDLEIFRKTLETSGTSKKIHIGNYSEGLSPRLYVSIPGRMATVNLTYDKLAKEYALVTVDNDGNTTSNASTAGVDEGFKVLEEIITDFIINNLGLDIDETGAVLNAMAASAGSSDTLKADLLNEDRHPTANQIWPPPDPPPN